MSRPTRETAAGRAYLDLQNRARREGRGTQELLTLYVVERWLDRMSRSPYSERFILKGGMLLAAFGARRPTVDADALARGMANDVATVAQRIAEIAGRPDPDDGVEFLTETMTARIIRDDALYSGVRVTIQARIATAAVKFQLDVSFGDPVTPEPQVLELPALRPGVEPVRVLGYRLETVLAEKIATAIDLGPTNTRLRDFADIYTVVKRHDFAHEAVRTALLATAGFRGIALVPLSVAVESLVDLRRVAYAAYRSALRTDGAHLPVEFAETVAVVVSFADPLLTPMPDGTNWSAARGGWGK